MEWVYLIGTVVFILVLGVSFNLWYMYEKNKCIKDVSWVDKDSLNRKY